MWIVFLKLLLAHVIGDFVLQPQSLAQKKKGHIAYLLWHITIHFGVLSLLFIQDWQTYWPTITVITCAHLAIDCIKIWWERRWPSRPFLAFCMDQSLHLFTLIAAMFFHYDIRINVFTPHHLLYLIASLLVLFFTPVFMRIFFSKWEQENSFSDKKTDTLLHAGLVIGILERTIIVLFIQIDFLAGIGFLMAAKSIFRFGDLTNAKNTKFTEYILVGTFLSFTLALFIGFGLKWAIQALSS